jgi:hypothetical protein
MSELGQKLPVDPLLATSGLPRSTDIARSRRQVWFVPAAGIEDDNHQKKKPPEGDFSIQM